MQADHATCCLLSYNRLEFVREAITSMIGNAHYPIELIVHDDGSSDPGVRQLLREFVDSGAISTLIENPPGWNQGQGVALNRMFAMATGDPIIKLDHDLVFMPGWLEQAVSILDQNERMPTEPRIGALGLFHYHAGHPTVDSDKTFVKAWEGWEQHTDFVGSAMLIPRDAWRRFGLFGEHSDAFAEDSVYKQRITADPNWCCALTPRDLAVNQGFGIGPSTLVEGWDHDTNEGILAKIHHGPRIVEFR